MLNNGERLVIRCAGCNEPLMTHWNTRDPDDVVCAKFDVCTESEGMVNGKIIYKKNTRKCSEDTCDEYRETNKVRIKCPFCDDSSLVVEIPGGGYYSPGEELGEKGNLDNNIAALQPSEDAEAEIQEFIAIKR